MSKQGNINKNEFLGMPFGTAQHRLRKLVLFYILQKHGENVCFRCGKQIDNIDELSIEHKTPWLNNSPDLFWDITNIAFSHLSCNIGVGTKAVKHLTHDTATGYKYGCRCSGCKSAHAEAARKYRKGVSANG